MFTALYIYFLNYFISLHFEMLSKKKINKILLENLFPNIMLNMKMMMIN